MEENRKILLFVFPPQIRESSDYDVDLCLRGFFNIGNKDVISIYNYYSMFILCILRYNVFTVVFTLVSTRDDGNISNIIWSMPTFKNG